MGLNGNETFCKKNKKRSPSRAWIEDEQGVASTIGTIMSLTLFMFLFSMFTSQYVPVWMEDNEAQHMTEVESQFGNLRWGMDNQILSGQLAGSSTIGVYTPISLGAPGVPMFSSPTIGYLNINTASGQTTFDFNHNVPGHTTPVSLSEHLSSQGNIELEVDNRYFVEQTFVYENDAIILKQPEGSAMRTNPQFYLKPDGGNHSIIFTMISLSGQDASYAGFGTRGIQSLLRTTYSETFTHVNSLNQSIPFEERIYLNHTTEYGEGWATFFNNTFTKQGFSYGTDFTIHRTLLDANTSLEKIELIIEPGNITSITINTAYIDLEVNETGG